MPSELASVLASVGRWDHHIALWLNQYVGNLPALDRFVYDIAASPLLKGGLFMAFLWWQWFRRDEARSQRREIVLTALAGAIIAIGVARTLQLALPFRERPLHDTALALTMPSGMNPETLDGWSSLPSDHAVLFFALATAVFRLHRGAGIAAFLWTALAVCLPRLYLGYHYASDVLSGAVIGIGVMSLSLAILQPRLLARPLLRWERAHATSFYCLAFLATLQLTLLFQDVRMLASDTVSLVQHVTTPATQAADKP
jgi:undecaprenyl-diphosphatase